MEWDPQSGELEKMTILYHEKKGEEVSYPRDIDKKEIQKFSLSCGVKSDFIEESWKKLSSKI